VPAAYDAIDIAGIGGEESLADLDRRRFSGAIGTEQCKTFTGVDPEVEAVDGDDVAVCLAKSLDSQRGSGRLCRYHHRGTSGVTEREQNGARFF